MNPQEVGNRLTDNTVSQLKKPLRKSLSLGVQPEIMSMPDCMCEWCNRLIFICPCILIYRGQDGTEFHLIHGSS
jgi:hypothetical protein